MITSTTKISVTKLDRVAKVLKTIAHPVKLQILECLQEEEPLDVSTICERIASPCEISMMSHHLAKLRDNGILLSQKKGKQVFYQLADRGILKIFDCMDQCDFIK